MVLPEPGPGADRSRPTVDLRSESDLWDSYLATRDDASKSRLIVHYSPIVKFVASRIATGMPSTVEQGDLVSNGMFGLIDAIEKFEPERGYKFETYAMRRIRGAIIDGLRAMDWVPRSVRSRVRELDRAMVSLEAELGRTPTEDELCSQLGWKQSRLRKTLNEISTSGVVAIDEALTSGDRRNDELTIGATLADPSAGPLGLYEVSEMRHVLADIINSMSEREKLVLTLYYYESFTLTDIGRVLGVTESRVCQIHTKALMHLRHRIDAMERV